jgi:hypothetical protein
VSVFNAFLHQIEFYLFLNINVSVNKAHMKVMAFVYHVVQDVVNVLMLQYVKVVHSLLLTTLMVTVHALRVSTSLLQQSDIVKDVINSV